MLPLKISFADVSEWMAKYNLKAVKVFSWSVQEVWILLLQLWLWFSSAHHSGCSTRETSIPDNHDPVSGIFPCHHQMGKENSSLIVQLMEQNWFSKNFGPKRIMSELCRHNIKEEWIPSQIQI
jgi:hypothetical protein